MWRRRRGSGKLDLTSPASPGSGCALSREAPPANLSVEKFSIKISELDDIINKPLSSDRVDLAQQCQLQ